MSGQGWQETLIVGVADGPTLTAAAAASCIPVASKLTFPTGYFDKAGKRIRISAQGRISCAITTPGTGRFDIRLGGTVIYDTAAFNLNTAGKANVPWTFEVELTQRGIGNAALTTFMGQGAFQSEAIVGSAAPTAGGNASLLLPVGAPVVGTGVDCTAVLALDMFWTPSLGTASLTVHQYLVESLN